MDMTWIAASRDLMRRGISIIAVVIDPTGFGGRGDPQSIITELYLSRIPAYLVHIGDDLAHALSHQSLLSPRSA
jgi:hypothetical protein